MTTPLRDDECLEFEGTATDEVIRTHLAEQEQVVIIGKARTRSPPSRPLRQRRSALSPVPALEASRTQRLCLASILSLCLAACASSRSAAPPAAADCGVATHGNSARSANDEETAAANAMVTRFVDSWNRADGAAYGVGYWSEAELVDPTGTIHTGRAAIAQMHVDLWNSVFKGSVIQGSIRRIAPLDRNFLLVDVDLALTQFKQLPAGGSAPQGVIKTHLKHLLEKREGVWRIIAAQNTFVSEAPQKQPRTK